MANNELKVGDKVFGFDHLRGGQEFIATIKRIEGTYAILEGCPGEGCCPLEELHKRQEKTEQQAPSPTA